MILGVYEGLSVNILVNMQADRMSETGRACKCAGVRIYAKSFVNLSLNMCVCTSRNCARIEL